MIDQSWRILLHQNILLTLELLHFSAPCIFEKRDLWLSGSENYGKILWISNQKNERHRHQCRLKMMVWKLRECLCFHEKHFFGCIWDWSVLGIPILSSFSVHQVQGKGREKIDFPLNLGHFRGVFDLIRLDWFWVDHNLPLLILASRWKREATLFASPRKTVFGFLVLKDTDCSSVGWNKEKKMERKMTVSKMDLRMSLF